MGLPAFTIDLSRVERFEDFIEAVNVGFVRDAGGEWNGNFDGLNDFMSWPEPESYELVLVGSKRCAHQLGHAEYERKLRARLETCHPANCARVEEERQRAARGEGPTLFDALLEIMSRDANVKVILR